MVYYDKEIKTVEDSDSTKPNGIFDMCQITKVQQQKADCGFSFVYSGRTFLFRAPSKPECDIWVNCLQFLVRLKEG